MKYSIHKGITGKWGAIQFNLKFPENLGMGKEEKEGCIFVDITSATAPNVYNWAKKIVMALSVNDISQLLLAFKTGSEISIFHDPGANSSTKGQIKKSFSFSSPKGTLAGGMISVSKQQNEENIKHTVPISGHELLALCVLFERAIPACLDW